MRISSRDNQFETERRCSQSGQGAVEYILLLLVAVMIFLGVIFQFNDAFRVYANNYFGEYLGCLLETGELPSIDGTGGAPSSCAGMFKAFSLADGRPYKDSGGGGSPGGGKGGEGNGSSGSSGANAEKSKGGYVRAGGGSGRGGGGSSAGGGRWSPQGGAQAGGGGAGKAKARNVYTGSTESSTPQGAYGTGAGASRRRQLQDGSGFYVSQQRPEDKEKKAFAVKLGSESQTQRKQTIVVQRRPAAAEKAATDEPVTFGDYFRYLLIAALIIALVLVLGGQLMQISSEME